MAVLTFLGVLLAAAWALLLQPQIDDTATKATTTKVKPFVLVRTNGAIGQRDSGKLVHIARKSNVELHLTHQRKWKPVRVIGNTLRLERIDYVADPGFDAWRIVPVRAGPSRIVAAPFNVTVDVRCLPQEGC